MHPSFKRSTSSIYSDGDYFCRCIYASPAFRSPYSITTLNTKPHGSAYFLRRKMRRRYNWCYDFMSFIRKNTPDDATILFPHQFVWSYSNGYFLLPRRLHYGNREILRKLKPPVYVVIYKEFPTFKVEGPRMIHDSLSGLIHYQPKSTGE